MGIGLPTFGFDDDISTGWDEESDTRTCGPYYTTYTIDFHTVVTVLTSRVPIVVTKEEYTTTKNEPALGTLAKSPDATSIPKGAVPINSLEPNTPAPTRVVPVPTNPPSGEDKPLPWPLIVTTASAGIGLVLPDGNIVPTGSVATFSGVRVSVPKMFEGAPLTAVFINGNSFPLPPSGNSGKESLQINPSPVPAARILDLLRKERPILFFADGQVLESGGTIMLSNHKITFSEDARTIEVDGILINTLLPIVRDGVIIGGLITLPDGSHIVVTSKSEFVGDSQLWSSMLDMLRPTSSITDITKAFEAEVLATKGDSKTWLIPSSAYLPSETGSELSSTRSIAPARDIKQLKYWILVGIFGLLL
jgi:hypothetical protein